MSIPGFEVHRSYDEWGPVRVFEEGTRRYMAFDSDAEQSCVDLSDPTLLAYQYTQAMMLALLFQSRPQQVTVLGLGAGSLIHSLCRYDAELQIEAVELRPLVVEMAQQWFGLAQSPQLKLHINDAERYMRRSKADSCDLIFSDIYNDHGMIDSQLNDQFLQNCFDHLTDNGVLVLNLWDEGKGINPLAAQRLWDQFGDNCLSCPIEDGNLIALAFKGGLPDYNPRRLQRKVNKLSQQLGIRLHRLAGGMKPL
ncbi:MAG: fused MFS/spermidine synthase [Motiliproteus sp.]